jgi:DNA polymerase
MNLIPFEHVPHCTACELHDQGPGVPIHVGMATEHLGLDPDYNTPAVVLVGQNPGFNEDQQGRPFVGKSGEILREAYIRGIQLDQRAAVFLTNGVRCYTIANFPPPFRCYKACSGFLHADLCRIDKYRPRETIVVTLGGLATASFHRHVLGNKRISLKKGFSLNGEPFLVKGHPGHPARIVFFCTYHPAYLLRNPNAVSAVHDHMQLVSDFLDGTMASPTTPTLVPTRSPKE